MTTSTFTCTAGGGGMFSGLGAAMAQGAAMGVGSSLGRMAVGSMFGGSSSHAPEGKTQQRKQRLEFMAMIDLVVHPKVDSVNP